MVNMFASNAIDRGFEHWSGKTKDYEIYMCCFSAMHAALKERTKTAWNQNNVSEWSDICLPVDCCFNEIAH